MRRAPPLMLLPVGWFHHPLPVCFRTWVALPTAVQVFVFVAPGGLGTLQRGGTGGATVKKAQLLMLLPVGRFHHPLPVCSCTWVALLTAVQVFVLVSSGGLGTPQCGRTGGATEKGAPLLTLPPVGDFNTHCRSAPVRGLRYLLRCRSLSS